MVLVTILKQENVVHSLVKLHQHRCAEDSVTWVLCRLLSKFRPYLTPEAVHNKPCMTFEPNLTPEACLVTVTARFPAQQR